MGRRGPPPKPLEQKKLEGTLRADRHAPEPLQLAKGVPARPRFLVGHARSEWDRVVAVLGDLGVLSTIDGGRLADYCEAHALAIRATAKYKREGLTVKMPSGVVRPHPMLLVAKEARAQARLLAAEFGLTPASRTWINAGDRAPSAPKGTPGTDSTEKRLFDRPGLRAVSGGKADGAE